MKLSELTPEQKTRMLAELDGWSGLIIRYGVINILEGFRPELLTTEEQDGRKNPVKRFIVPSYLTSYDAIIPLIQRLPKSVQQKVSFCLPDDLEGFDATPSQLCDAVLVATGNATI